MKIFPNELRGVRARIVTAIAGAFALIVFDAAAARAATMHFKVDVDRSTVSASVAEPAAFIRGNAIGTFRIIDGAVSVDPANISGTAKVRVLIDATSYRSDNASRDRSVTEKSLEADKYPTIGFESNSIVGTVITNPHEGTAIVTGFLTLHGITKPVALRIDSFKCVVDLPATQKHVCGADAVGTFNRADFGITVGQRYGFKMEVTLHIQVEAIRAE